MAQSRQGEVENSIGSGEAKELTCTTHGHELRWGNAGGRGAQGGGGIKGRKKWGNCNSIIIKYIFLKTRSTVFYQLKFTLQLCCPDVQCF